MPASYNISIPMALDTEALLAECTYQTSQSGGPGGQHANKVETQVTLRFSVTDSQFLADWQKDRLRQQLQSRLTKDDELLVHSNDTRSQHRNKELVQKRFLTLLKQALRPPKVRKKTRPSRRANQKRLDAKKRRSEKKQMRKPPSV